MAAQMITVRLSRGDAQPWGFRLQGGADFGTPLVVQKVNGGSLADQAGLMPGDAVIKINDMDIFPLRHKDAQDLVVRSGNTFVMSVQRGGSTWRPHVTPTGQMPSHQSHLGSNISTVTRTSLAHKQPQPVEHIGCGYNNAARPFNSINGGDGHVKSIVNKQYNTPVGIYSEEAIAETLSAQAEVLAGGVLGVNFKKNEKEYNPTNSEVLKFLKEEESHPQEPAYNHNIQQQHQHQHQHQQHQHQHYNQQQQQQQYQQQQGATRHVNAPIDRPKPQNTGGLPTGQNICAECERLIVGVFCRIKDKNLHVECFKCATCGTPLKNQGYYNYNNKLYCDIHAKLAAMQNPPPGTDGYIPIPIKPTPKLSASNIANALNAHGYNLQTNGATPHLVTGPMPASSNHEQNISSSANPLQVSHSRASSSSSTSSGTTGKSSSCLSSLSQQSSTSLDKFSTGHNRQSSLGGGGEGLVGGGGLGDEIKEGIEEKGKDRLDGRTYNMNTSQNDINNDLNTSYNHPQRSQQFSVNSQINLSFSIPPTQSLLPPPTISNNQLESKLAKNSINFEQNSSIKSTMNNNNNLQNENDMNTNNNGQINQTTNIYNQFLNKYTNKSTNDNDGNLNNIGIGIDSQQQQQRAISPFPNIPFPPESDDPMYGKISPYPTIPPPINQQMQYVTLQGNVIRSVIPPGKGISVDYKVGGHGGPRPFNQGPMSPQMSGPRSPAASYPPPQHQHQQQNWAQQSKPVGQSPYATLPRTNASQQDTTNTCDSPPLPPPPPPEFLQESMRNPVAKNTITIDGTNSSPKQSTAELYIPGQATEMLANSIGKININNKKNFMAEAGKVISNLLEARIANNNNNNYNNSRMLAKATEDMMIKPLPDHPLKNIIEICDNKNIPCSTKTKQIENEVPSVPSDTELVTATKNLTDNNFELKPLETVTFRNKNLNSSDKSKRLSTQAFDRRSYIEKDLVARNGNKIENIPTNEQNTEVAKNVSADLSDGKLPVCCQCNKTITKGPFITALGRIWCPEHFMCVNGSCRRPLQDIGFVEEKGDLYCEYCFEKYLAPTCSKCNNKIKGDCLNAIGRHFHPECFICAYCGKLFGNTPFFLEEGEPYCETDWNELFTTKCYACGFPVEAGDRWVEALNHNYHSQCFNCTMCKKNLEGTSFYNKGGRPFCKNHAR